MEQEKGFVSRRAHGEMHVEQAEISVAVWEILAHHNISVYIGYTNVMTHVQPLNPACPGRGDVVIKPPDFSKSLF